MKINKTPHCSIVNILSLTVKKTCLKEIHIIDFVVDLNNHVGTCTFFRAALYRNSQIIYLQLILNILHSLFKPYTAYTITIDFDFITSVCLYFSSINYIVYTAFFN